MLPKIYLSYSNGAEEFELPVLPEEIEIKEKSDNKNYILQNIGEITVINTVKLATLTLKGIFPSEKAPYVSSMTLKKPLDYINILKKWRDGTETNGYIKKPIRINVTDNSFPFTWACTIESLDYKEVAGEVGNISYSIELKEYRYHPIKKGEIIVTETNESGEISTETKTVVTETRPVEKEISKNYTVKAGDTLYAICKKHLGNGDLYKEIAKKNNISNPNLIFPGQVLTL